MVRAHSILVTDLVGLVGLHWALLRGDREIAAMLVLCGLECRVNLLQIDQTGRAAIQAENSLAALQKWPMNLVQWVCGVILRRATAAAATLLGHVPKSPEKVNITATGPTGLAVSAPTGLEATDLSEMVVIAPTAPAAKVRDLLVQNLIPIVWAEKVNNLLAKVLDPTVQVPDTEAQAAGNPLAKDPIASTQVPSAQVAAGNPTSARALVVRD